MTVHDNDQRKLLSEGNSPLLDAQWPNEGSLTHRAEGAGYFAGDCFALLAGAIWTGSGVLSYLNPGISNQLLSAAIPNQFIAHDTIFELQVRGSLIAIGATLLFGLAYSQIARRLVPAGGVFYSIVLSVCNVAWMAVMIFITSAVMNGATVLFGIALISHRLGRSCLVIDDNDTPVRSAYWSIIIIALTVLLFWWLGMGVFFMCVCVLLAFNNATEFGKALAIYSARLGDVDRLGIKAFTLALSWPIDVLQTQLRGFATIKVLTARKNLST